MFMNQMKKMYVMSLMQKKYLFMAFKFRALKVKLKTFRFAEKYLTTGKSMKNHYLSKLKPIKNKLGKQTNVCRLTSYDINSS